MATTTWYGNGNGSRGTKALNIYLSGSTIPSNATISSIVFDVCMSVEKPAGSQSRLYVLRTTDKSVYFIGQSSYEHADNGGSGGGPAYTNYNTTVWNNHDYYTGDDGVEGPLKSSTFYWFLGKSSATLTVRCNNNGSGTSYVRGVRLHFTYTTNQTPNVPTVVYPVHTDKYTYNPQPWCYVQSNGDPDGESVKLGVALYNATAGTWPLATVWSSSYYATGYGMWYRLPACSTGTRYRIYCYAMDDDGAISSGATRDFFYAGTPTWVSAGSVLSTSHYNNLSNQIDTQRAYYGLTDACGAVSAGTKANATDINWLASKLAECPSGPGTAVSTSAGSTILASQAQALYNKLVIA